MGIFFGNLFSDGISFNPIPTKARGADSAHPLLPAHLLASLLLHTLELNRIYSKGLIFLCVFTFQGFNPLFEYRDLSAWRVNISKVATHRDVNGKNSFFFVIEVQRCGSSDQTPNPESTNSEFFPRNGVGFFNELIFFYMDTFLAILILKQKSNLNRSKQTANFVK